MTDTSTATQAEAAEEAAVEREIEELLPESGDVKLSDAEQDSLLATSAGEEVTPGVDGRAQTGTSRAWSEEAQVD